MSTKFPSAVQSYCKAKKHSKGTSDEYKATVRKWTSWGQEIPLDQLSRSSIRDFLDWIYDDAVQPGAENPERTSNKARDHVRAVAAWAWENDIIESLPRFQKPRSQRDGAGIQSNHDDPSAFRIHGLPQGIEGECPCCRRKFAAG